MFNRASTNAALAPQCQTENSTFHDNNLRTLMGESEYKGLIDAVPLESFDPKFRELRNGKKICCFVPFFTYLFKRLDPSLAEISLREHTAKVIVANLKSEKIRAHFKSIKEEYPVFSINGLDSLSSPEFMVKKILLTLVRLASKVQISAPLPSAQPSLLGKEPETSSKATGAELVQKSAKPAPLPSVQTSLLGKKPRTSSTWYERLPPEILGREINDEVDELKDWFDDVRIGIGEQEKNAVILKESVEGLEPDLGEQDLKQLGFIASALLGELRNCSKLKGDLTESFQSYFPQIAYGSFSKKLKDAEDYSMSLFEDIKMAAKMLRKKILTSVLLMIPLKKGRKTSRL